MNGVKRNKETRETEEEGGGGRGKKKENKRNYPKVLDKQDMPLGEKDPSTVSHER